MQDDEYANLLNERNPYMIYTLSHYQIITLYSSNISPFSQLYLNKSRGRGLVVEKMASKKWIKYVNQNKAKM